ncbi:TPA: hypothetical protein ACSJPS_002931 [Listeria monocytogenes]
MNKARLKMEAIERMKLVKLDKSVVKEFENENKLNYSKSGYVIFPNALNNTLHIATSEPLTSEMEEVVAKFEAREKVVWSITLYAQKQVLADYTTFYLLIQKKIGNMKKQKWSMGA